MKSGFVVFKDPLILHEGLESYPDFTGIGEDFRHSELYGNGLYLDQEVFNTDMPDELKGMKCRFREKYFTDSSRRDAIAYLVDIKGYEVIVEDSVAEEIPTIPEHLFEI